VTLWLANIVAYSVQIAVLVGSAAVIMAIVRVEAPRVALRFWQTLFAACVILPVLQLSLTGDGTRVVSGGGVLWSAAAATAGTLAAGIAPLASRVATFIVAVLAAGAVVRLAWLGLGLVRLRAIRDRSQPAETVLTLSMPLQHELGVRVDVRFADEVSSPATIGVRRPIVLLPHLVADLAPAVQRAILCHELIHVRQRDWIAALVEESWCALLWYHPAARALASRLALSREMLVDQATIALTRDRQAYAAALLEFSDPRPRLRGATALIGRRHLEQRIARIAQENPMSSVSLVFRTAVAATIVAIATLGTTAYLPISAPLQAQENTVYKPGSGITVPQVVREVMPTYTPAAMRAKIQGSVWMRVVVLASGNVGDVEISRSLDTEHGLDQQAINAMRQWTFVPGKRDGKPVAVEVTVEMTFTLRK
jgi:TonB family protein